MIPIDRLLADVGRAATNAAAELKGTRSVLADPLGLACMLMEAEQRREDSQRRLGHPVPRFCLLSVTWRCNLRCTGCYARNYQTGHEMGLEEIRRVILEARDLGCGLFVIVGGEPLMVPNLVPMLSEIDGALMFLFTNATLMDAGHVSSLAEAPGVLPVLSVEGDRVLTDARRGSRVGAQVAEAMEMLRAASVPFGFSVMATRKNLATVVSRAWFDELWNAGVRFGFVIDYIPFEHDLDPSLVLRDEDLAAKRQALAERYAEARPIVINFPPDEYETGHCQAAGTGFIHVNADGFVEPCPFSHWAADNVRDRSLSAALASPFLRRLREEVAPLDNPRGECLLFRHRNKVAAIAAQTGARFTERSASALPVADPQSPS